MTKQIAFLRYKVKYLKAQNKQQQVVMQKLRNVLIIKVICLIVINCRAPCTDTNCVSCPSNNSTCVSCDTRFGLDPAQGCTICSQPHCIICTDDYTNCTKCVFPYGLDGAGACITCVVSADCNDCGYKYDQCYSCNYPLGVNMTTKTCMPNAVPNCSACLAQNNMKCTFCQPGYGVVLATSLCAICTDPNCAICSSNAGMCTICKNMNGFYSGVCVACLSPCVNCRNDSSYDACTSCIDYHFVYSNYSCLPCISNCRNCSTIFTCDICKNGYYLDTSIYTCISCPPFCYTCLTLPTMHCTSCNTYYQLDGNTPQMCRQICGDSLDFGGYPCDNQIGIVYDGCNDDCQIMDNFSCNINATSFETVCSYNIQISIQFISINRVGNQNKLILTISILPPLYVFKTVSMTDMLTLFNITDQNIIVNEIKYDLTTNQLQFYADFTNDISSDNINVTFLPNTLISEQYFATPNLTISLSVNLSEEPLHFYTNSQLLIANIFKYLCYWIVAMSLLAMVFSYATRKLAGIQCLFVVQWSWIVLTWLKTSNNLLLASLQNLKYSAAFKINIFGSQTLGVLNLLYPFLYNSNISEQKLSNNFNISLICYIIPTFAIIITYIRFCKYKKQTQNMKLTDQIQQRTNKLEQYLCWACLGLMYGVLINLQYFVQCSVLFFKYCTIQDISSLVIFGIGIFFILFTIVLFYKYPTLFDYFLYSFDKQSKLALSYYLLYIFCLILSVTILVMLPIYNISAVIPILLLFVYTIAKKPYSKIKQNYRSAFNLFVMCVFIGLKAWLQYCPKKLRNSTISNIFILICIFLLIIAILLAWTVLFYYFYYEKYIHPSYELPIQIIKRQVNYNVLNDMNSLNINKKIKKNGKFSIFSKIIPPNSTLKHSSDSLKKMFEEQQEMVENTQRQRLIQQLSKKPLRIQNYISTPNSKKYKQNSERLKPDIIFTSKRPSTKNQQFKIEQIQLQKAETLQPLKQDTNIEMKLNSQLSSFACIPSEIEVARRAILGQNIQINLMGVNQFIDKLNSKEDQNYEVYIENYEGINPYQ